MKNSLSMRTLIVGCTIALALTSTFSSSAKTLTTDPDLPNAKVSKTFKQNFPQIKEVNWTKDGNVHEAAFKLADRLVVCHFNKGGRLLSTLIYSVAHYLPLEAQVSLTNRFKGYTLEYVTEHIHDNEHDFYVVLKRVQGRTIHWLRVKTDREGINTRTLIELNQIL